MDTSSAVERGSHTTQGDVWDVLADVLRRTGSAGGFGLTVSQLSLRPVHMVGF